MDLLKSNRQGKDAVNLDRLNIDEMLEEVRTENVATKQLLQDTATRNNKGIECEKAGQEDEAIAIYEDNITEGWPATHSFDRLMKIYRRRKDYREECRVISRAIEIFSAENQRRADNAIKDEPSKVDEISDALLTCQKVMGSHGFYCFVPYDIDSLRARLHKAEMLLSKQETFANVQSVLEIEKYVPFMTPDELHEYELAVTTGRKPVFSPSTLSSWQQRASEREEELVAKFVAANAKSERQCKRPTVKR